MKQILLRLGFLFQPDQELKYQKENVLKYFNARIAVLIAGTVLWALFGFFDYMKQHQNIAVMSYLRYGVGLPICLITIYLTFLYKGSYAKIAFGMGILLCAVRLMIAYFSNDGVESAMFAITLFLTCAILLLRWPITYGAFYVFVTFCFYATAAFFDAKPFIKFLPSIGMLSIIAITLFACIYWLERGARAEFNIQIQLDKRTQELMHAIFLREEERVKAQKEHQNHILDLSLKFENKLKNATDSIFESSKNLEMIANDILNNSQKSFNSATKAHGDAKLIKQCIHDIQSNSFTLKTTTESIEKKVGFSYELSKNAVQTVQRTDEVIEKLNKTLDKIKDMTDYINSISSKTKYLSMNATIESLRLGEEGKGAQIVAQEVKDLSKRGSQAVHDIIGLIDFTENVYGDIMNYMQGITQTIRQIDEISNDITRSLDVQDQETLSIENSISKAVSISSDVFDNISSVTTASEIMTKISKSMVDVSSNLSTQAEKLKQESDILLTSLRE